MGRGCGVGGEEEKWEEGERARMFCLAPWAPYSVLLGALGPPLKSNLNWKLSESDSFQLSVRFDRGFFGPLSV